MRNEQAPVSFSTPTALGNPRHLVGYEANRAESSFQTAVPQPVGAGSLKIRCVVSVGAQFVAASEAELGQSLKDRRTNGRRGKNGACSELCGVWME